MKTRILYTEVEGGRWMPAVVEMDKQELIGHLNKNLQDAGTPSAHSFYDLGHGMTRRVHGVCFEDGTLWDAFFAGPLSFDMPNEQAARAALLRDLHGLLQPDLL